AGRNVDEPTAVARPHRVAVSGVDRRLDCHRIVCPVVALGAVVADVEDTRSVTRRLVLLSQGARHASEDENDGSHASLGRFHTPSALTPMHLAMQRGSSTACWARLAAACMTPI